jgi:multisubunit Na+/H+ antiporter MnhE subunit
LSRVLIRAALLTSVYLLVLTSVSPGDVLVGGVLGLAFAALLRPHHAPAGAAPWPTRVAAAAVGLVLSVVEMARGTWRVVRFCLGAEASPGFVEIPRGTRSRVNVALWGVITGEAPDEYPVDVDGRRGVLIVHLVDAGDPQAVRERHRHTFERWQGKVVP